MVFGLFKSKNTILYFGCTINFGYEEIKKNYRKIIESLEIDYIILEKEPCCGIPLLNAGYLKEFEHHKNKVIKAFNEVSAYKIICFCPSCTICLKEILKDKEVLFSLDVFLENLDKFKTNEKKEKITIHDPCHLSRGLKKSEELRTLLKSLGYEIVEPEIFSKEFSFCCGGGGGLPNSYKQATEQLARKRLEQLKDTNAKKIITCCPMCYHTLKTYSKNEIEVLELSELLLRHI